MSNVLQQMATQFKINNAKTNAELQNAQAQNPQYAEYIAKVTGARNNFAKALSEVASQAPKFVMPQASQNSSPPDSPPRGSDDEKIAPVTAKPLPPTAAKPMLKTLPQNNPRPMTQPNFTQPIMFTKPSAPPLDNSQASVPPPSPPLKTTAAKPLQQFNQQALLQAMVVINTEVIDKTTVAELRKRGINAPYHLDLNSDYEHGFSAIELAVDYNCALPLDHIEVINNIDDAIRAANRTLRPYFQQLQDTAEAAYANVAKQQFKL